MSVSVLQFGREPSHDDAPFAQPAPNEGTGLVLRPYQSECVRSCLSDLRRLDRIYCELATGLGKSVIFSELAKRWKGSVLVVVHLEELLIQGHRHLESMTGESVGIERGSERGTGERIQIGTIQTLSRRPHRIQRPTLILIDEAHHAASRTYRQFLANFRGSKVVGLSATGRRPDGKPLPFQKLSFSMTIADGVDGG